MARAGNWLRMALWAVLLAGPAGCLSHPRGPDNDPFFGIGGRPIPRSDGTVQQSPQANGPLDKVPPLPPADSTSSQAALTQGAVGRGPDPRANERPAISRTGGFFESARETPAAPAAPATDSFEQVQQMLLQRGVVWQQLKTGSGPGEWLFSCAIPDPQNPKFRVNYEARAVGPNGVAAMKAVIAQIDQDRK